MDKTFFGALLIFMLVFVMVSVGYAQSPQETLTQYISDLQKNPNDNALREKIIKHAQTMSSAPKIPAEVDELVGQAKYVFKHAKGQKDYLDAVDAYKKVLTIAPWIGDYYYNLGVAQEQAGQLEDAIKNFNLYLLASPDAKDAREVRERIGGLKYAAKKAEKAPSQAPVAEVKRDPFEDLLRKIDGRRYTMRGGNGETITLDVRGKVLVNGFIGDPKISGLTGYHEVGVETEIKGRETIKLIPVNPAPEFSKFWVVSATYTISEDGSYITIRSRYNDGDTREYIYLLQR